MPGGVTFSNSSDFFSPVLNDAGQTAFRAITVPGNGIWSERSGGLAIWPAREAKRGRVGRCELRCLHLPLCLY